MSLEAVRHFCAHSLESKIITKTLILRDITAARIHGECYGPFPGAPGSFRTSPATWDASRDKLPSVRQSPRRVTREAR